MSIVFRSTSLLWIHISPIKWNQRGAWERTCILLSLFVGWLTQDQIWMHEEIVSGPHCLFLVIFMSWAFLATKGQSAAVAAQYMLSGQQNQLASGQQPAGQEVSSGPHWRSLSFTFIPWVSATRAKMATKTFILSLPSFQDWGDLSTWPLYSVEIKLIAIVNAYVTTIRIISIVVSQTNFIRYGFKTISVLLSFIDVVCSIWHIFTIR